MVHRFANEWAFQLLWLVPLLFFLGLTLSKRADKKLIAMLGKKTAGFLANSRSTSKRKWKLILQCLVLILFTFALARPQSGQSRQKVKSEGIELMFLVDVSRSMLAEDVRPSRLGLAKKELERFLDLGGGDKVGIIAFAGSGILLSPITTDKSALKMYLQSLTPDSVSTQGTNFSKALQEAWDAFKQGGTQKGEGVTATQAVVLVSDGEDHEEGAIELVKKMKAEGIRLFSLAVGTQKGGAIPIRDERGELRGYRKDKTGKVVLTQTSGEALKRLASAGGGNFYFLTFGSSVINQLRDRLRQLKQSEFEDAEITSYDENYQMYLFFGILLALIELFMGERKLAGRIWKGRFEVQQR